MLNYLLTDRVARKVRLLCISSFEFLPEGNDDLFLGKGQEERSSDNTYRTLLVEDWIGSG